MPVRQWGDGRRRVRERVGETQIGMAGGAERARDSVSDGGRAAP
jgi:hypothetical protein